MSAHDYYTGRAVLARKADAQQLINALVAQERECQAKLDVFNRIMQPYGLANGDVSQLQDKFDRIIGEAENAEEAFNAAVERAESIKDELEDAGEDYPFGLDLQFV